MGHAPGRDPLPAMERLLKVITLLARAGPAGIDTDTLVDRCGYGAADRDDRMRQFSRDRRQLTALGWQVENVARGGETGRHRLKVGDNRLRVVLTPAQRTALVRAAAAVGSDSIAAAFEDRQRELTDPRSVQVRFEADAPHLDLLLRAVSRRCLVDFDYRGRRRCVHPHLVTAGPSGWYLAGREDEGEAEKFFLAPRMTNVALHAPGTAEAAPERHRPSLDPLDWDIDAPARVVVATHAEHHRLVEHLLGRPEAVHEPSGDDAGHVLLTYTVRNRAAFRSRIYELATRVRIVEPDDVRDEIVDELRRLAGGER